MVESKLSSKQGENLYEINHDCINLCHKLIAFFVIYEVASRGAICILTFLSSFFKWAIAT